MYFEEKTSTEALLFLRKAACLGSNIIFKFTTINKLQKRPAKQDISTMLTNIFPQKLNEQFITLDEMKQQYKVATASWVIEGLSHSTCFVGIHTIIC